jgi:AcrR family transcriptional regulator
MTETVKRPLSRDLVLETAISLVDHEGLGALSMRRLGQELGVEAMSLYHHVANKEALLDGMVDAVVGAERRGRRGWRGGRGTRLGRGPARPDHHGPHGDAPPHVAARPCWSRGPR